uniref:Integrase catalytic domain-containing protein n=1 Tax=Biomphalaria glabrata TaxID=6526 RepID=A0A2C9KV34_BIOGL
PQNVAGVETDASDIIISAILSQNKKPVAFFSRTLSLSERRQSSVENETMAIVESIKKWRHFILGSHFKLTTDQRSVSFMLNLRHHGNIKNDKIIQSVDFKGPLPSTTKNKYLLTIIEEYSRFPFAYACPDRSTQTVIRCFTTLFSIFGTPSYLHSDRGSAFMSEELRSFLRGKGIVTSRTTAYNAKGNGQVEKLTNGREETVSLHHLAPRGDSFSESVVHDFAPTDFETFSEVSQHQLAPGNTETVPGVHNTQLLLGVTWRHLQKTWLHGSTCFKSRGKHH